MKVLIACEFSGVVREAFRKKGHDAWSCDIDPVGDGSKFHYEQDVFEILDKGWDLMIAHPPCTFIANSSSKHLYVGKKKIEGKKIGEFGGIDPVRWKDMEDGARFFKALWETNIDKICVENPIMLGYAKDIIGCQQTQTVQPWMFGHPESKATCLWLKNLPKLEETDNVYDIYKNLPKKKAQRIHYMSKKDRNKLRSITYQGIANAMAEQWGS